MACRIIAVLGVPAMIGCGSSSDRPDEPSMWTEPVTGMEFIHIEPGEFTMGLPTPDELRPAPPHRVRITRPFYIGRFEVTQEQWQRVMGTAPSQFSSCGRRCPVESVSWYDAQEFVRRLQENHPGEVFRLPTEAEWEYACRGDTGSRYGTGQDTLRLESANYDPRIFYEVHEEGAGVDAPRAVGSYPANSIGLRDMAGNVWEWTMDEYCPYPQRSVSDPVGRCGSDTVAIRGGSWAFSARAARCGHRYIHAREDSGYSLGFRVLREVSQAVKP